MDPFGDDVLIYEKALREDGVKTEMVVYPGLSHGDLSFNCLKSARKGGIDSVKPVVSCSRCELYCQSVESLKSQ